MKLNELLNQQKRDTFDDKMNVQSDFSFDDKDHELEAVLSIIRKINTSLILPEVLSMVIDHAIRIAHAERGFLMLADKENHLQYIVGHDKDRNVINSKNFQVSDSVLEDVFRTGESFCIEDALHDERFDQRQSIVDLKLQTIMCAPLKTQDAIIGVVYLDSRIIQAVNRDEVLRLFEILAGQAAIAIQNARLYEDLKKTYEELKEANEHIIRSERMALRGEMAAEVSHELNNILSIVLLQTESLRRHVRQADKENSEKLLDGVGESIRKIQVFAENLLVRSSLKSELFPFQLNDLIRDFAIFVKASKKFRTGKIVLDVNESLPEINGDKDQIQQVLLNLVKNAFEAYGEATVNIKTVFETQNKLVHLSVSDNGPGLDPIVKEKMFTEKITTKPNGHGFGLPVCKKIIQNHGGDIVVESISGEGTKFIISLPVSA